MRAGAAVDRHLQAADAQPLIPEPGVDAQLGRPAVEHRFLLLLAKAVPARHDVHADRQQPCLVGGLVGVHFPGVEAGIEDAGDPEPVEFVAAQPHGFEQLAQRGPRHQPAHQDLGPGAQQPVRLAVGIPLDPPVRRVRRAPGDVRQPEGVAVHQIHVEEAHQDHGMVRGCRVDVVPRGQLTGEEVALVPPCPHDPLARRGDLGAFTHQLHHLLGRPAFVQADEGQLETHFLEMRVAVEKAGDHRPAAQIDGLGAIPGQRRDLRRPVPRPECGHP